VNFLLAPSRWPDRLGWRRAGHHGVGRRCGVLIGPDRYGRLPIDRRRAPRSTRIASVSACITFHPGLPSCLSSLAATRRARKGLVSIPSVRAAVSSSEYVGNPPRNVVSKSVPNTVKRSSTIQSSALM
jgi:hypothetical protein